MGYVAALSIWILGLMTYLQPVAPWEATYKDTADAIARVVAVEEPLFEGPDGRERTAVLMVSVAFFESNFKPGALGDCGHEGPCKKGEVGKSHGRFQVQGHGELLDPLDDARAALIEMRASMRACRAHPVEDRLAFYASGNADGCENAGGQRASRNRMKRAMWLYKRNPSPIVVRELKGNGDQ